MNRLLKEMGQLVGSVVVQERDEAKDRLLDLRKLLQDLDKLQGHKNRYTMHTHHHRVQCSHRNL
jgi:hypothetical protein